MYRLVLDISKQGLYMFFDPTNMMDLRDYSPIGEALVCTPEIENAVRSGIVIDVDGITDIKPRASQSVNHDYVLYRLNIQRKPKAEEVKAKETIEEPKEVEEEIVDESKEDSAKAKKEKKSKEKDK